MRWMAYLFTPCVALSVYGCGDDGDASSGSETGSESDTATDGTAGTTTAGTDSTASTTAGTMSSESNSTTDTTTTTGSETSTATESGGTEGTATSGDSTTGGTGSLLEVSGTFGTDSIDYSCDFTDPVYGTLMCDSGRWFATCRPNPTAVGAIEIFQVWFVLSTDDATMGVKDYIDTQFGISMGDATAQMTPLSPNSLNAATNTVTVDADTEAQGPVSGSFEASWTDDGGQYGSVSGTFSFNCP